MPEPIINDLELRQDPKLLKIAEMSNIPKRSQTLEGYYCRVDDKLFLSGRNTQLAFALLANRLRLARKSPLSFGYLIALRPRTNAQRIVIGFVRAPASG